VFKIFEYPKPFTPELTDDAPIICANYSPIRMEFYIAGEMIWVWNAWIGKPVRELKNCMESDITCVAFDKDHWKLILGDHNGNIKVFDILSGICIGTMKQEFAHTSEVSFIAYAGNDLNIVSCSWDKKIKVFWDGINLEFLRERAEAHSADIITGDYSHNLGLIVTGGWDNKVWVWDYERVKMEFEILIHGD